MTSSTFLDGKLLLAMPSMTDPRFERSVIYMCSHDASGAMGLVINQAFSGLSFESLLEQLDIEAPGDVPDVPVHSGGPVEPGRGFVLHSADFVQETTLVVSETLALSATVDILQALAAGKGPRYHLLALAMPGGALGSWSRKYRPTRGSPPKRTMKSFSIQSSNRNGPAPWQCLALIYQCSHRMLATHRPCVYYHRQFKDCRWLSLRFLRSSAGSPIRPGTPPLRSISSSFSISSALT